MAQAALDASIPASLPSYSGIQSVHHKILSTASSRSLYPIMASHSCLTWLCALSLLFPGVSSHIQMEEPSPLRDPHSQRMAEPKDYNILAPLHPDGSDFACKLYQYNTPLTSVATYQAGKSYTLRLGGSATHGGGSCQVSLSCDYRRFKVIKSIQGNCPIDKEYQFTIPNHVPTQEKCLLAWTWYALLQHRL